MAGQIHDLRLDEETDHDETVPWLPALAMAAGVALIGALRASSPWFWPGVGVGTALVLWSCSCVLPDGTLRLVPGRRAGIATLLWVCAFFLTLDYLVAPSAHDVLGLTPTQTGWALTAGGIGWSAVAIACGARPAREPQAYRRRTMLAAVFFVVGTMLMVVTVLEKADWWGLPVGYGVASIGMGLTHLDTMNRIVTELDADDAPATSPHDGVLVRVAQESLANIARHSDASQVWVRLDGTPAGPRIRITDDGVGFTPVFAAGHGLSGMRDRLAEIGGSLRVDSAPGKGCTVTAVVPS